MKTVTIIQPSLRKKSYTDILCKIFEKKLQDRGVEVHFIDLRKRDIELCDGREIYEYSRQTQKDYKTIQNTDIVIFGFPVYHYAITGVLKNFIDISANALQDKTIDFIVTAIFPDAHGAYEHIIQSLKIKYDVEKISLQTVYCLNSDFMGSMLLNQQIEKDIGNLAETIINY